MTNIKNNKSISAAAAPAKGGCSCGCILNPTKAAKHVPLFNNPTPPFGWANQSKIISTPANRLQQPLAGAGLEPKGAALPLAKGLVSSQSLARLENFNNSRSSQRRVPLVFLQKKGSQTPNPNIISYNFPGSKPKFNTVYNINKLITNNVYKLLFNFFKSMYCLISKPVFITTPDKIKIQLFYFVCIPKILINKIKETKKSYPNSLAAAAKGCCGSHAAVNNSLWLDINQNQKNSSASQKLQPKSGASGVISLLKIRNFNSKDLNVKINLKKLAQSNLTKVYPHKFKLICTILSKFFNKTVELELIRLHQPYYDSNILVNFLALIINKKNIGACIQRLYNSNIIKSNKTSGSLFNYSRPAWPLARVGAATGWDNIYNPYPMNSTAAYLSGLNIKISGRLMREPIIPRITTKKFEKGFTAKGKINYSDVARFTHKNRKGAFTITVKSGQNF